MLELSVTSMRKCESCTTNLNTPAPYAHMGLVTLMSHMKFWRENDKQYSVWTFRGVVYKGVLTFVGRGLAFNGYILSYFEGKIN